MITMIIQGGLGNQMFQYAFAKALSLKYNQPFQLDLSFIVRRDLGHDFVYRNYDLGLFLINPNLTYKASGHFIEEPSLKYSQETVNQLNTLLRRKEDVYLQGYWQSELYFKEIEDVIREDFRLAIPMKKSPILQEILSSESVMINVRRKDFVTNSFHGTMGTDYYKNAVERLNKELTNPKYFIFGDDIDWCRANLKFENSTVVDHDLAGYKFSSYLGYMKNCKHFVIPNSSFAWWAAWLNKDRGTVIYPEKWFSEHESDITSCFIRKC